VIDIPICTCFVDGCAWTLSQADVELKGERHTTVTPALTARPAPTYLRSQW